MRAIVTGDNQLDLYRSMDDALRSMERPEAASGDYLVFDESGRKYEFEVDPDDDSYVGSFSLKLNSTGKFDELLSIYIAWVEYNEFTDLPRPTKNLFNELEAKWGFQI